jgi:hypothetical protein
MKKRKKTTSVPRHKRLKRSSRLQAARHWIPKYEGQNLVKGYSKHFAVDKLCAVKELTLLGYKINEEYVEQLKHNIELQIKMKQKKKELREENIRITEYEAYENMFWDTEELIQENDGESSSFNVEDWDDEIPF